MWINVYESVCMATFQKKEAAYRNKRPKEICPSR